MKTKVSVVIPVYNEESRLPKTLEEIKEYVKQRKDIDFEIVIVDDGSKDKTVRVSEEFKKNNKNLDIKILKNAKNSGKGFSVKHGILEGKGDYLLFMDADSSTSIRELEHFIPILKEYDILVGSRHLIKNSIKVKQPLIRRFAGFFAHKLIHLFIIENVKDTMCGFKMFNKKSKMLFRKQLNNRWGFDYELLYLARKMGFKIKEIPVHWKDDRQSKVTIKGYLTALIELFRIRINDFLGRYK